MKESSNVNRIKTLQSHLGHGVASFYFTHPLDLFYFTGLDLSTGVLLIDNQCIQLLVDSRYLSMATSLKTTHGIEVIPLAEKESHLPKGSPSHQIGFVASRTPVSEYLGLPVSLKEHLTPVDHLIADIRSIKDPVEIQLLQEAAMISEKAFLAMRSHLQMGIREEELAALFLSTAASLGALGSSFNPIIAFGKNSAHPHHRAGSSRFEKGIVLYDLGVMARSYASDMTRCDLSYTDHPLLLEDYKIIKEAYEIAFSLAVVGARVFDLDQAVRAHFRKWNREDLFTHSLGHGIGLEVHEYPRIHSKDSGSSVLLKEHMAITLEPALYREGLGGIRLENTVIITSKGPQCLNRELPL